MHWEKIGARSWLWRPHREKFLQWCPDRPMIETIAQDWEALQMQTVLTVASERVTQGDMLLGSTFKIVGLTMEIYEREHPDYQNYRYICEGSITL